MKKLSLITRILVSAALIAFLAISPPFLKEQLGRDPYKEFLGGAQDESWSGVLTLWHIVSFKTYQGSVTAYLEGLAAQYEKDNPGVYVEVSGLTPDAMAERLARGERPDLWSIPIGALDEIDFAPLTAAPPAFTDGFAPYEKEDGIKAFPYLASGYYLMGNTLLTQELGLAFPDAQAAEQLRAGDAGALSSALQAAMGSKSVTRFGALCAPELIAAYLKLEGRLASEGDFKAGQVPFMIGDARACGELTRKMSDGGFTFDWLALGGFTDQVQYIGADADISLERGKHASALIELLLGQANQLRLTALGAVPVVPLLEAPAYADGAMAALYEAYRFALTPKPDRYSGYRDALLEEAKGAVEGDAAARNAFEKRLSEILKRASA